jgi:hypothetical protein
MSLYLKPFHGCRIHPDSNIQQVSEIEFFRSINGNFFSFHTEALPALYLYLEKDRSGTLKYIGLIGLLKTSFEVNHSSSTPVIWTTPNKPNILSVLLKPWIESPEIEITQTSGDQQQLAVIQSFQTIQEIILHIQAGYWACSNPNQIQNPFVCLSLDPSLPIPSNYPAGILLTPPDYAQNTSPFSTGF